MNINASYLLNTPSWTPKFNSKRRVFAIGRAETTGIYLLDLLRTQMNYQEVGYIVFKPK